MDSLDIQVLGVKKYTEFSGINDSCKKRRESGLFDRFYCQIGAKVPRWPFCLSVQDFGGGLLHNYIESDAGIDTEGRYSMPLRPVLTPALDLMYFCRNIGGISSYPSSPHN